jgi:hypothetical protein
MWILTIKYERPTVILITFNHNQCFEKNYFIVLKLSIIVFKIQ